MKAVFNSPPSSEDPLESNEGSRPRDTELQSLQTADGVPTASLLALLASFLKIGSIGFGGGMAVIALMEQEFVRKRRLLSLEEFVSGVGLSQMLGAFAVNTAVFIGYRLFGVTGALFSAGAFLMPSVVLVILLSDLYFRYHAIPALHDTVAGLGPVVIALILSATWSIGRKVLHSWPKVLIGAGALTAGILQTNPVWVLIAAGAAGFLLPAGRTSPQPSPRPTESTQSKDLKYLAIALPVGVQVSTVTATFFKIGLVFFGGGFVLVPILHGRLVTQLGWLEPQEFLDGLAISNLTPGPVAVLATFAGYRMAGVSGALAATVALFAPGIMLMIAISYQYGQFRSDQRAHRFLAGVNPAVAGLILSAAFLLGRSAVGSWHGSLMLVLSLVLLVVFRWHPAFVLAIGAAAGYFGLLP